MVRVSIIYPTDPLGKIPGGTDTCIRDILRFAPHDIEFTLVGVSTDPVARPANRLTRCSIAEASFNFFPISAYPTLDRQMCFPLSLRFTLALVGKKCCRYADVLQFHRIEPSLLFLGSNIPKVYVIHQNMKILNNKNADIRWKYFPKAYFTLEDIVMPRAHKVFVVREDGVRDYQRRYPDIANRFEFLPTWMNPELFSPLEKKTRNVVKHEILSRYGWRRNDFLFVSVGRIDHQKNPFLLIDAFEQLKKRIPQARLLMIGEGVLRNESEKRIIAKKISDSVRIVGALAHTKVVELLQISDAMVLSSAYEGMPRCVVEALGCGVPVVSTNVGEVKRVLHNGKNGYLVSDHSPDSMADAMEKITHNHKNLSGCPCLGAVKTYTAESVLEDVYENYRLLAPG